MTRIGLVVVVGVLVGLCGGCGVQKPKATLNSVSLSDLSSQGLTIKVGVDVTNPNTFAVPVTGVQSTLSMGTVKLLKTTRIEIDRPLGANETRLVNVLVPITYDDLLGVSEVIVKNGGNLPYSVEAAVEVDTGVPLLGKVQVPVRHDGILKVKELLMKNIGTVVKSSSALKLAQRVVGKTFGMFK